MYDGLTQIADDLDKIAETIRVDAMLGAALCNDALATVATVAAPVAAPVAATVAIAAAVPVPITVDAHAPMAYAGNWGKQSSTVDFKWDDKRNRYVASQSVERYPDAQLTAVNCTTCDVISWTQGTHEAVMTITYDSAGLPNSIQGIMHDVKNGTHICSLTGVARV
jgi:hypothetical protein